MAIEYLGLSSLNGPLAVLEGVSGAAYGEIVEMTVYGKEKDVYKRQPSGRRWIPLKGSAASLKVFPGH